MRPAGADGIRFERRHRRKGSRGRHGSRGGLDGGTCRRLSRAKSFLTALEATGELSVAKLTLAGSQIHELAAR